MFSFYQLFLGDAFDQFN